MASTNDDEEVAIFVKNTGFPPNVGQVREPQSWTADIALFSGLTGGWEVVDMGQQDYSNFDAASGLWLTKIVWRKRKEHETRREDN